MSKGQAESRCAQRITAIGRRVAPKRKRGVNPFDVMAAALPWLLNSD